MSIETKTILIFVAMLAAFTGLPYLLGMYLMPYIGHLLTEDIATLSGIAHVFTTYIAGLIGLVPMLVIVMFVSKLFGTKNTTESD